MGAAIQEMAFTEDRRSGKYLLWSDTGESLRRLGLGVALATLIGLTLGIGIGLIPLLRRAFSQFVATICLIPPLAILPILFIVFGLGEVAKVALIVLGTAPVITRDIAQRVSEIPAEQIVKAQTLGANTWQIVMRVALPQALPRLVVAVRLSLGAAWLFLISSEAIAATDGLGYRIFLVRRYLAMDIIIPYVAWITLLAFVIDQALRILSERAFRWSHLNGGGM
jgi:NitT/TauT family transport system permease protein